MRKSVGIILILLPFCCHAQGLLHGIVADMETHVPIKNARVYTDTNHSCVTNYKGEFSISKDFKKLTISHLGYLSRILYPNECGDTIYLVTNMLKEVVVWGYKKETPFVLRQKSSETSGDKSGGGGLIIYFDMAKTLENIFGGQTRIPSKKEQRKNQNIWKNY